MNRVCDQGTKIKMGIFVWSKVAKNAKKSQSSDDMGLDNDLTSNSNLILSLIPILILLL